MKHRCLNPKDKRYKDYGGRGITVCSRWKKSFKNFIDDMGERPKGYSIDRKDNNKGYSPDNCYWATDKQQALNKRIRSDNKTGYKGISYDKRTKSYSANIHFERNTIWLGRHRKIKDAIIAVENKKKELGICLI